MIGSVVRLRALLTKEFRHLLRDPRMRFFVIVPPLIQLMVFGYAATFDVREAQVGVVDYAHTFQSRKLLSSVTAGGHFQLQYFDDMSNAADAMNRGSIQAIVHLASEFPRQPVVQLIADGSDSNSAQIVVGQLSQIIQEYAQQANGLQQAVRLDERTWYNPNMEDREHRDGSAGCDHASYSHDGGTRTRDGHTRKTAGYAGGAPGIPDRQNDPGSLHRPV
jgi:ABC-2 type transport system permease protein